jgi:hypothetical protein
MAAYFPDAPDVLGQDMAAVRQSVAEAAAAVVASQREAARFLVEYGADVVGGRAPVGEPGRMGDPDPSLDAADSRG